MKNIIDILLLLLMFCYTSCDILDVNPKSFTAPDNFYKTKEEITSALYGAYGTLHNVYLGDYEKIFAADMGVDVMISRQSPRIDVYNYYNMESLTTEWSDRWQAHYNAIGVVNMVINRTKNSSVDDDFKKQIIAEAKVLRAFIYHDLVLFWGGVPMWLDEFDLSTVSTLPRSPREKVIEQIYDDIRTSIPDLPSSYDKTELGRITSWAAKALWARVCLLENDWQNAYDLSCDVINNSPHDLMEKYSDIFDMGKKFNKELIFVVPSRADASGSAISTFANPRAKDEQTKLNPLFNKQGYKTERYDGVEVNKSSDLFYGWGMFNTTEHYLNSFKSGDSRKDMVDWSSQILVKDLNGDGDYDDKDETKVIKFSGGDGGGRGHYMLKWYTWGETKNNGSRDVHLMRLGEVYLIKAEAANELDKPDEAIDALNELRKRAFGDELHNYPDTYSKEEIKRAIVDENKWELGGEGLRRWYLVHWGYEYLEKAVKDLVEENPIAAQNIRPYHVLFKIPVEEFIKNPNLGENNPGY